MHWNQRFARTALALAACAAAPASQAAIVFSLADGGTSLIRFESSTPGSVVNVGSLSGATVALDGLDFRPADGMLYGYHAASSGLYRVDPLTGATTFVSTATSPTGAPLGIDFNPTVDRLRVVSTADENRRINVDTGATTVDGALAYAAGDRNAGANPSLIDAAYTNSDTNPATGTTLYYIDIDTDALVSTTNPNGGVLTTIGLLGLNADRFTGLDIFTSGGVNTAFASFHGANGDGLYTIDLATGLATLVGSIGASNLFGLAVAPPGAVVPEPSSLALLGLGGLAAVWGTRRGSTRRREAAPV